MATNKKTLDVSSVVTAYEAMSKAYQRGRMGKREMECVMLNLRYFLTECEIYRPMLTISRHELTGGRADDE